MHPRHSCAPCLNNCSPNQRDASAESADAFPHSTYISRPLFPLTHAARQDVNSKCQFSPDTTRCQAPVRHLARRGTIARNVVHCIRSAPKERGVGMCRIAIPLTDPAVGGTQLPVFFCTHTRNGMCHEGGGHAEIGRHTICRAKQQLSSASSPCLSHQ